MVVDTIMEVITEMGIIIIKDVDIIMDTTTIVDIVTIKENDTELKMVDMGTITAEAIMNDLRITDLDVDNLLFYLPRRYVQMNEAEF
jgi:hypothetical protein